MGVQKGTKRGPYKRCQSKRQKKNITEDGLSYQEIARIMDIPASMVKEIERKAFKKLLLPTDKNKKFRKYIYD